LKELFNYIKPGQEYSPSQILILKIGEREISCAVTNKEGAELHSLAYCVADNAETIRITDFEEKYPIFHHSYYDVKVIFDYPQSILLPSTLKTPDDSLLLLESYYGKLPNAIMVTEEIPEWQLKNIFAIPKEEYEWVTTKLPAAKYSHHYTTGIKKINNAGPDGLLLMDFRKYDFSVITAKQSGVMMAQTFAYAKPEDVLYYLLVICRQYSFSPKEVSIQLSGLIDKQSSLFKELYQYFVNVDFRKAGWSVAGSEYPAHFFTSLNDLAPCAS
jgi:hypothetical protein